MFPDEQPQPDLRNALKGCKHQKNEGEYLMSELFFNNPKTQAANLKVLLLLLLLTACAIQARAQNSQVVESGKFRLHKFEQPVGVETYEITRRGDSLVVKSDFKFTDRGSPVPLTATLQTKQNLTPEAFEIKGSTSRGSTIDTSIQITGNTANIREGKKPEKQMFPPDFLRLPVTRRLPFSKC